MATLPFQGAAGSQDLLGPVRRCIALSLCLRGARNVVQVASSASARRRGSTQCRSALAAEFERGLILGTTVGTQLGELGAALPAEFHRRRIFELTAPAPHRHT